jgi:hypothetical protein
MRARIIRKSSAARGRARSRRSSSMRARIIGKSSETRGRVMFPLVSCDPDCELPDHGERLDQAGIIVPDVADHRLSGEAFGDDVFVCFPRIRRRPCSSCFLYLDQQPGFHRRSGPLLSRIVVREMARLDDHGA